MLRGLFDARVSILMLSRGRVVTCGAVESSVDYADAPVALDQQRGVSNATPRKFERRVFYNKGTGVLSLAER